DGALPLAEVYASAVRVDKDLDLNVAGVGHVLLEEQVRVPEVRERDGPSRSESGGQVLLRVDADHPDPATAPGRLEHQGIPEGRCDLAGFVGGAEDAVHASRDLN